MKRAESLDFWSDRKNLLNLVFITSCNGKILKLWPHVHLFPNVFLNAMLILGSNVADSF